MAGTQTVRVAVTVSGLAPGTPPMLAWVKRLRGPSGRTKHHTQWTPVPDAAVFRRLQDEVQPGEIIEIVLTTDWDTPGSPTHVADFVRISTPTAPSTV
jgi:hypothetical protein